VPEARGEKRKCADRPKGAATCGACRTAVRARALACTRSASTPTRWLLLGRPRLICAVCRWAPVVTPSAWPLGARGADCGGAVCDRAGTGVGREQRARGRVSAGRDGRRRLGTAATARRNGTSARQHDIGRLPTNVRGERAGDQMLRAPRGRIVRRLTARRQVQQKHDRDQCKEDRARPRRDHPAPSACAGARARMSRNSSAHPSSACRASRGVPHPGLSCLIAVCRRRPSSEGRRLVLWARRRHRAWCRRELGRGSRRRWRRRRHTTRGRTRTASTAGRGAGTSS
jgi:hypothetical protein